MDSWAAPARLAAVSAATDSLAVPDRRAAGLPGRSAGRSARALEALAHLGRDRGLRPVQPDPGGFAAGAGADARQAADAPLRTGAADARLGAASSAALGAGQARPDRWFLAFRSAQGGVLRTPG